ncbi:MAG: hydroxyacylglutathione hydrolase [Gammaproteobacteria bacterium]|nr:hydroxyacylglutathione hydrolase [Gammaproteobacteria bacterium]
MIVEQVWVGNAYRNFNYLVACPDTGEALAIDPLDYKKCLALAQQRGWRITTIVNTHEHGDHTGGNRGMRAATGAKLLAHHEANIAGINRGLFAGDVIRLGRSVEFEVLDTPGHTMTHVCLLSHSEAPGLFCGDTLFNAGAGNCYNGGHPPELYQTFATQLSQLPDSTRIYPGHDYLANNLSFTADREPGNEIARALAEKTHGQNPEHALITTLAQEKQINVFFRLNSPQVIAKLRVDFPDLDEKPQPEEVFLRLRELRNDW